MERRRRIAERARVNVERTEVVLPIAEAPRKGIMQRRMMCVDRVVQRRRNRGFSLIELLIVIAIILIISAIAIPRITSTKRMANEVAAIRSCQTINTAQIQYFAQFGRYASTLDELGPAPGGGPESG